MTKKNLNVHNIKHLIINGLIGSVLFAIILNQVVWLDNMYDLFQREFRMYANQIANESILMELTERSEKGGGFSVYSHNLISPNDSSRFFSKKIVTKDSTYALIIEKNDQNAMFKIMQFALKNHLPVNLDRLSEIYEEKINEKYVIENIYFDYIDLKEHTLLKSNKPTDNLHKRLIITDTIPLDIINSIGVIGYIKVAPNTILNKMFHQLILSILLILIAAICLIFISRSFILQWKIEKMRQESINAMTHEFKRPISGAVAMVSTIPYYLEKKDHPKILSYSRSIENELNKLVYYTQRIQQISNNEKQEISLEKEEIEIVPFFESLQQRYNTSKNEEPTVIVNLRINTRQKVFHIDLLHFSNVMENLIENAIKYTIHQKVIIDLQVISTENGMQISVSDNGIGISSTDIKLIFDKYYRVKRDETKSKVGFGLGLTYVKSIIEAHGGDIRVESNLNKGSIFVITLKE